jgi:hypothetical protein
MSIPTSTESLENLARILDFDLGDVDALPTGDSAQIIRVTSNGEIALRSLDGEHPFDALVGFDAPPDWEVFGVVAPGWGSYYEGPRKGERRRCRVIFVASRHGEEASLLRFAGDDEGTVMREPDPPGRVADCVRRALDLPTPPPDASSLLALWFHEVLQRLVARRHPSASRELVGLQDIDDVIGDAPASWADERWKVVEAGGNFRMDGSIAGWMDDGMFARFTLAELPEPTVVMAAARTACTPAAWEYLLARFAEAALSDFDDLDDLDDSDDEPF